MISHLLNDSDAPLTIILKKKPTNMDDQHCSLQYAKDIKTLCQPLFEASCIHAFSYSFILADGSRAELWSHKEALAYTFFTKRYLIRIHTPDLFSANERYIFLEAKLRSTVSLASQIYLKQLLAQRNLFGHGHAFVIARKSPLSDEHYIFYSPPEYSQAPNFYLNHLPLLENFVTTFNDKAISLIKLAKRYPVVKPWRREDNKSLATTCEKENFIGNKKQLSHTFLPVRLTPREIAVASLMRGGANAPLIAEKLCISPRTVEKHIDNLRDKCQLRKKARLVSFFNRYPFVFSDFLE